MRRREHQVLENMPLAFARPAGAEFRRSAPEPAKTDPDGKPCGSVCAAARAPSGSSVLHEASYELSYGERGARVALVASEPITGWWGREGVFEGRAGRW